MLLTGLCFVAVMVSVKYLSQDLPSIQAAFIRYLFGLILILPLFKFQYKKLHLIIMSQLKLINYRSGFSLLEVVISLLIISVTFLAYGQLIEQNLRAQDLKQNFIDDHQLKTNVLTIYVANPMIDNSQIRELLVLDSISHKQLSRYNALVEIEIEFEKDSDKFSFKVIR